MGKTFCTRCGYEIAQNSGLIDISRVIYDITGEKGTKYRFLIEFGSNVFGKALATVDRESLSGNSEASMQNFKEVRIGWAEYAEEFKKYTKIDLTEYDKMVRQLDRGEEAEDLTEWRTDFFSRLAEVLEMQGSHLQEYERMQNAEKWIKQVRDRLQKAPQQLFMCWVTTSSGSNTRNYKLAVLEKNTGNIHYPVKRCCPHCKKEIPVWLGKFEQRIVGIVGGQSAGKTSFITALTDLIKTGAIIVDKSSGNHGNLQIMTSYDGEDDYGWLKHIHMPGEPDVDTGLPSDERSPYWYYRSAYSVEKTNVTQDAISVISFLVKHGRQQGKENIFQYVLVDIPGEAFADPHNYYKVQEDFFRMYGSIIYQCSSLLILISTEHLEGKASINLDYHRVLENAKGFFGGNKKEMSIGLLVSMFDKLLWTNNTNFKDILKLPFDLRKVSIYSVDEVKDSTGQVQIKDYFAVETMQAISMQLEKYVEQRAPGITTRLSDLYGNQQGGKRVAFFPVSAYGKNVEKLTIKDEGGKEELSATKQEDRTEEYKEIVEKRFLTEAPFLWIMACDGILDCGRRRIKRDALLDDMQQSRLQHLLQEKLYWKKSI